jgi:beta-lactamase superfamily II metal-dependent hydrolase
MFSYFSKKFFLQLAGLFSAIVLLVGISFFQFSKESNALEVIFFDIGQGDGILIKTPTHQKILIDGGPDNKIIYKIGQSLPFYEKKIDLMILTHPHADHLTGLIEVLRRYEVKKILSTGVLHTTPDYLEWLEEIKERGVPMEIAKAGQVFNFGDVKLEILYPSQNFSGERVENLNNTSIVSKLTFGSTSFLLAGDAEAEVEEQLIAAGVDLKADVLKVGHHGSKDATSQEFLDKVSPQVAVIQVGAKNKYGHPSRQTISRLERAGVQIFRNDLDGDVKMVSDGVEIEIKE